MVYVMGLRGKILSGFMILVLMLAAAGVWSIYQLSLMGTSVQKFLQDNYKSIQASNDMLSALNEENGAILLLLKGEWEGGRRKLKASDSLFMAKLEFAESNITILTEKTYLSKIRKNYLNFKNEWLRPIVDTPRQGNLAWYYDNIYINFSDLQKDIKKLIAVNDKAIYETSSKLKSASSRAIMPGIISVIAALIFTFMFLYFINYYFISPIIKLKKKVKDFIERKTPFVKEVESDDEIKELEDSIRLLCEINESLEK